MRKCLFPCPNLSNSLNRFEYFGPFTDLFPSISPDKLRVRINRKLDKKLYKGTKVISNFREKPVLGSYYYYYDHYLILCITDQWYTTRSVKCTGPVKCTLLGKLGILTYTIHDNNRSKISTLLTPCLSNWLNRWGHSPVRF